MTSSLITTLIILSFYFAISASSCIIHIKPEAPACNISLQGPESTLPGAVTASAEIEQSLRCNMKLFAYTHRPWLSSLQLSIVSLLLSILMLSREISFAIIHNNSQCNFPSHLEHSFPSSRLVNTQQVPKMLTLSPSH